MRKGLSALLLSLPLAFAGCEGMTIGGPYQHIDMSNSHYAEIIRERAIALAEAPQGKTDLKAAAELSGYIGELDVMDEAAKAYFEKDPRSGLFLFQQCDKVHNFYEGKK